MKKSNTQLASRNRRMFNYILDSFFANIIVTILAFLVGVVIGFLQGNADFFNNDFVAILFSVAINVFYYTFFETMFSKTPAKFITKTHVCVVKGKSYIKVDFWHILGRSLCRFIPFDLFSFFFQEKPRGWHDRFSSTVVLND